jgi:hypothetical protein
VPQGAVRFGTLSSGLGAGLTDGAAAGDLPPGGSAGFCLCFALGGSQGDKGGGPHGLACLVPVCASAEPAAVAHRAATPATPATMHTAGTSSGHRALNRQTMVAVPCYCVTRTEDAPPDPD